MKTLFYLTFLVFLFSCKNDTTKNEILEEIEFTIDSTLFNYNKTDTFGLVTLPHLIDWSSIKISQNKYKLNSPDNQIQIEIDDFELRKPNSFKFYKEQIANKKIEADLLDIATFKKNGKKVIQVILKKDDTINFKLIEDLNEKSKELNIFIDHANYIEENIRIVESIIGSMTFI